MKKKPVIEMVRHLEAKGYSKQKGARERLFLHFVNSFGQLVLVPKKAELDQDEVERIKKSISENDFLRKQ